MRDRCRASSWSIPTSHWGKPIWTGDLRKCPVQPGTEHDKGGLQCSSGWDAAKKRTVLNVAFKDRVLTLGSSQTETEQGRREEAAVLRSWEESLVSHHKWVQRPGILSHRGESPSNTEQNQRPKAVIVQDGQLTDAGEQSHLKKD